MKIKYLLIIIMGLSHYNSQAQTDVKTRLEGKIWIDKFETGPVGYSYSDCTETVFIDGQLLGTMKYNYSENENAVYDPNIDCSISNGNYLIFENNTRFRIKFIGDNNYGLILLRSPGEPKTLPGHDWIYYVAE